MAEDLRLLEYIQPGEAVFRIYGWQPYCISLGFHQNDSVLNKEALQEAGIDFVFRPTGGKAVLHAEEITYLVVIAAEEKLNPLAVYEGINRALLTGLTIYNPKLSGCDLETSQPDFAAMRNNPLETGCFTAPAKSELKFNGKKFCGSAQKYRGNRILQHGSLLTGSFHKKLPGFLSYQEDIKEKLRDSLDRSSTDVSEITGEPVTMQELKEALFKGMRVYTGSPEREVTNKLKTDYYEQHLRTIS